MTFDHERFKNVLAGLQSLTVSAALLVGGVWTVVTFNVLGQVDRARVELAELQGRLDRQAALEIDIEASQTSVTGDQRRYILASVTIKNSGTRTTHLQYPSGGPMATTPVTFDAQGIPSYGATTHVHVRASEPQNIITGTTVRAGSRSTRFPFIVPVQLPGVYLLAFSAQVSTAELQVSQRDGAGTTPQTWDGQLYFVVK